MKRFETTVSSDTNLGKTVFGNDVIMCSIYDNDTQKMYHFTTNTDNGKPEITVSVPYGVKVVVRKERKIESL